MLMVECMPAWLARKRSLLVRYEGRADAYEAFLHLACALDCLCCAQA